MSGMSIPVNSQAEQPLPTAPNVEVLRTSDAIEFARNDLAKSSVCVSGGFFVKTKKDIVKYFTPLDRNRISPDVWLPFGDYMYENPFHLMPILTTANNQEEVFTFYERCYVERVIDDAEYEVVVKRVRQGHSMAACVFEVNMIITFAEGLVYTIETFYGDFGGKVVLTSGQASTYFLSREQSQQLDHKLVREELKCVLRELDEFLFAENQLEYIRFESSDWSFSPQSGVIREGKKERKLPTSELCSEASVGSPSYVITPPRSPVVGLLRAPNRERGIPLDLDVEKKKKRKKRERTVSGKRDGKMAKNLGPFVPQAGISSFFSPNVDVSSDVKFLLDNISDNIGKIGDILPAATNILAKFAEGNFNINHTVHVSEDVKKDGIKLTHSLSNQMHVPMIIGIVGSSIMAYWGEDPRWKTVATVLSTAYAGYMANEHRTWFLDKFQGILSRHADRATMQPQGLDSNLIHDMSGLIIGYLALANSVKAPDGNKLKAALSGFYSFDRAKGGVAQAVMFTVGFVEKLFNFFTNKVLGWESVDFMEKTIPELRKFCEKVDCVFQESKNGTLEVNASNASRVQALLMEGHQLTLKKFSQIESIQVRNALNTYMTTLRKLADPFDRANLTGIGPRMEPLIPLFRAIPCTGKSYLLYPLIQAVLCGVLPPEELANFRTDNWSEYVYNRQAEHKYMDGYRGQPVVIYDDICQIRDVAGMPDNEYLEIIRMGNIHPYICHMADIGSKGTTTFRGKLIVATTNQLGEVQPNSIWEPEAFMRRFNLVIDVGIKKEYALNPNDPPLKRKIDVNSPLLADGKFNPNVYEFRIAQRLPSGAYMSGTQVIEWAELVQLLILKFKDKERRHNNFMSDLNEFRAIPNLTPEAGIEPSEEGSSLDPVKMDSLAELEREFDNKVLAEKRDKGKKKMSEMSLDEFMDATYDPMGEFERFEKDMFPDYSRWREEVLNHPHWPVIKRALEARMPNHLEFALKTMYQIQPESVRCLSVGDPERFTRVCTFVIKSDEFQTAVRAFWHGQLFERGEHPTAYDDARRVVTSFFDYMANGAIPHLRTVYRWIFDWNNVIRVMTLVGGALYIYMLVMVGKNMRNSSSILEKKKKTEEIRAETEYAKAKAEFEAAQKKEVEVPVEEIPELSSEGGPYPQRKSGRHRVEPRNVPNLVSQAASDPNLEVFMEQLVDKSQYEIMVPKTGERLGYCVFVTGQLAFCPAHYRGLLRALIDNGDIEEDSKLSFFNMKRSLEIPVSTKILLNANQTARFRENDLMMFHVPYIHMHPTIIKRFVYEQFVGNPMETWLALSQTKRGDKNVIVERRVFGRLSGEQMVHDGIDDYTVKNTIYYKAHTEKGDCGLLAAIYNRSVSPGKFISMHVAGNKDGDGIGAVITREMLEEAIKEFPEQYPPPEELFVEAQCMEMPFKGHFEPIKELDHGVSQPVHTKIMRSKLYNLWSKSGKSPAALRPKFLEDGTCLNPKILAIERYGKPPPIPNFELIRVAQDYVFSQWLPYMRWTTKPRLLTFEEACKGIPTAEYCHAIPRNTSAGFPYVLHPRQGFKGKEWYFGKDQEYDLTRPQAIALRGEVEACIERAEKGERSVHVYVDTLKDELRKIERVQQCKTRLVSAAPLTYTVLCRIYFMDFCMWFMRHSVSVGSGVGINPYSEDWDYLFRCLLSKGKKGVAGDYHGFDTSHYMALFQAIVDMMNRWYDDGEKNARVRRVIFADLWNSIHLNGHFLYLWLKSLPSGHFLTTIVNTIINLMLYAMCWAILNPQGVAGMKDYSRLVKAVCYGDDSIVNIADEALSYFNYKTIGDAMALLGYEYTDELKGESDVLWREMSEMTFLKRGFRLEPILQRWVAPLNMESILDMLYFTKKNVDPDAITCDNLNQAFMELSLHEPQDFYFWAPKWLDGARWLLNYQPPVVDRVALLRIAAKHIDFY